MAPGAGLRDVDWADGYRPDQTKWGLIILYHGSHVDRTPTVYLENGQVVGLDADDPLYVNYEKNFEGEPTALTILNCAIK